MIKKIKIIALLMILTCNLYSQSSLISFYPQSSLESYPTPEASELGKYGQVPVSYFNGIPEISIPLYTIHCKDIELPISISYHAAGNKPDEHPSWVGLGWNLNCGGMITRIVNGIRDEMDIATCQIVEGQKFTFEPGYYYRADEFDIQDWYSILLQKIVSDDNSYIFLDTQPDEFVFNFCGHSGSFWFVSENGMITVKTKDKGGDILKVEPTLFSGTIVYPVFEDAPIHHGSEYLFNVYKTFETFKITTRDGFVYEFGGSIENIDLTTVNGLTNATSWHLSKITSPIGNFIDFEYTKGGDVFIQRKSNYFYAIVSPQDQTNSCALSNNANVDGLSLAIIHPKYLSKISTSIGQSLNFHTSKTNEIDYNNWADVYSNYQKICNNLLPSELSFIKFDWIKDLPLVNYYLKLDHIQILGVKNINLFYTNNSNERLKLLGINTSSIDNAFPIGLSDAESIEKYTFSYNQTPLPTYNSRKIDNWGYYNNKNYSGIGYQDYSSLYQFRSPDLSYCKAEVLDSITYPSGGSTKFEYELNQYSKEISGLDFNEHPFTLLNKTGYAGGLRIQSIKNYYDLGDNTKKMVKKYYYTNEDNTSSGILSGRFVYALNGKKHIEFHESGWEALFHWSMSANYDVNYYIYSQHQLLPLSTTNGNHVTYSRVIEQESDGSKTIYNYTNHDLFPDEKPISLVSNITETLLSNFTSRELERGLLTNIQIYNSNNNLVKETKFSYNDDLDRYNNHVKVINRYDQERGTCGGSFIRYSANKIYTFYPYLKTKTETIYDINGQSPIAISNEYRYDANNLLTEIKTYNVVDPSASSPIVSLHYKYPHNYILSSFISNNDNIGKILTKMVRQNVLDTPIEVTKTIDNNIVESKLNLYIENNGHILPDKSFTLEINNLMAYSYSKLTNMSMSIINDILSWNFYKSPNYKSVLVFNNYDNFGNVTQYTGSDGIVTSLLWDASGTYIMAKVEGATYSHISTKAGKASNYSSKMLWSDLRETLETSAPSAMITTYSHKPLVGITEQTSVNGTTTYYSYDSFGRLSEVRDDDGNLLKKHSYNYANQ